MAEFRTIRADQGHCAALAEIERLWGAAEGTFEGDPLGRLVTLVEADEDKRWGASADLTLRPSGMTND